MDNAYLIAAGWIGLALPASLISIRVGIAVALVEIAMCVIGGNVPRLKTAAAAGLPRAAGAGDG